jgi:hypothetical protein
MRKNFTDRTALQTPDSSHLIPAAPDFQEYVANILILKIKYTLEQVKKAQRGS